MVMMNWISDAQARVRRVYPVPVMGLVLYLTCHFRVEILPNVFIFFFRGLSPPQYRCVRSETVEFDNPINFL